MKYLKILLALVLLSIETQAQKIEDFKIYDVIVFAGFEKGVPTHGALFLENDMILHQRYNFISTLESFRKAHFKYITYCLRHKNINI